MYLAHRNIFRIIESLKILNHKGMSIQGFLIPDLGEYDPDNTEEKELGLKCQVVGGLVFLFRLEHLC